MKKVLSILALFSLIFSLPTPGFANTWTGAAGTNKWNDGGNWSDGAPSGDATFNAAAGAGGAVIDIDGTGIASLNTLWFSSADADAYTIGLAGDTVALAEQYGNIQVFGVDQSQTIAADILLGTGANEASYNIISDSAGVQLTISGDITGGSSGGSSAQTVEFGGGGNTAVSGVIADGGGALALNKTGGGTLTLAGTNTYTGTTTINAGTLELSGGSAIADDGVVSLANVSGAVLKLNANETIGSLSGGGTTGGNVNLQTFTLTTGDSNDTSYGGVISGDGGLTKTGAGTLTLSNTNTYSGTTTVNAGTVNLSYGLTDSAVNFTGEANVVLAAGQVIAQSVTTSNTGQGTLVLNAGSSVTGDIGASDNSLGVLSVLGVTTISNANLWVDSLSANTAGTVTIDTTLNGNLDIELFSTTVALADGRTIDGDVTFNADGRLNVGVGSSIGGGHSIIAGQGGGVSEGNLGINSESVLDQVDYTTDGKLSAVYALGAVSFTTHDVGVYADYLRIDDASLNVQISFDQNVAIDFLADGQIFLSDGADVTGAITNSTLTVGVGNIQTAGNSVITGTVGATGAGRLGSLTISGAGGTTVEITGATYATDATIGAGTLQLDSNADITTTTIADTGALNLGTNADLTGSVAMNGAGSITLANGADISGAITVDDNNQGTLTVNGTSILSGAIGQDSTHDLATITVANGGSGTFSAAVYSNALTLNGTGAATLNTSSTIATTTIAATGALNLGTNADLAGSVAMNGAGSITLANGADISGAITVDADNQGTLTVNGTSVLGGAIGQDSTHDLATITVANGGSGTFSAAVYSNALTLNGTGAATLNASSTIATATIADTGALNLGTNADLTGSVAMNGAGSITLANGADISGAITVDADNQGTLTVNGTSILGGAIGQDSTHDLATITVANGGSGTFSAAVYSNALTLNGTGAATLNASSTIATTTFAGAGTLNIGAAALTGNIALGTNNGSINVADGGSIVGNIAGNDSLGTLTVANGTIDGTIGTNTSVRFATINGGATGDVSTFNHAIFADALNVTGAGTVALEGVSDIAATTLSGAGTLDLNENLTGTVALNAAGSIVNVATNKNISGAVTTNGVGRGTLNFEGTHTTGGAIGTAVNDLAAVNIQNGVLTMDHNIAAALVTVDSVAGSGTGTLTVTGARSITGNLTLSNSGVLNLGTNTLTMGGTSVYTQNAATGALNLTVASASSYGKITATGGNASVADNSVMNVTVGSYLANNTTLDVISGAAGSNYNDTTTYTINPLGNSHYAFNASSVAGSGVLTLTVDRSANGFASDAGGDTNAANVGRTLDNVTNPSADMLAVLNTLDAMSSTEVAKSLQTMMPDPSSGAMQATRSLNGHFLTAVNNRLAYARSGFGPGSGVSSGDGVEGMGFWTQGVGGYQKQNERDGIQGYNANTFGTMIGFDRVIDRHFRMGAGGGYGFGAVNSKTPGSPSTNINSFQGTVYGSYDSVDLCEARKNRKYSREAVRNQRERLWYVDGMLSFAQNNYDSRREIWIGADKRVAKADHYGQQYGTQFETGYTFLTEKTRDLEMTPFTSLGYNYLRMNKYKEKGADAMDLKVDGDGFNQLEQGLGLKLAYPLFSEKAGTFIPSIKGAWLYDYIADRFETTSSFAGGGPSFATYGVKPARNAFLLASELAFLNKKNMTLTGNFDWMLRDEFASYTYYLTVRFDF